MNLLSFIFGAMAGGIIGVVMMCLCFVSGEQSRMEERERDHG